jgi:anaerobic selenocysteine-containing dehydrogenase
VSGERVNVRSANGEVTGIAKLDDAVRTGVVSIPHGHHDCNVNRLTSKDDIDRVTGMVRYSGIGVSLHPA